MQDKFQPPPFDLAHIADQWGSAADDIYVAILGFFADEGAELCAEARTALTENRREALIRTAHTLKSAAANVGAMHLSGCAESLESAAETGGERDLEPLVARIETAWQSVSAGIAAGGQHG